MVKKELEIKEHWYSDNENEEADSTILLSKKKDKNTKKKRDDNTGVDYPVDIWFLISEHIRPEDVGRFAGICQASYTVIQSVQFWKSLYQRFYVKENLIPEYQPECLFRYFGLRTSVIRALFHMYYPFKVRTRRAVLGITRPDVLIGMKCIGLISKKEGKNGKQLFCHYFKFKRNTNMRCQPVKSKEQSVIELLNDINANPDEDHSILLVASAEPLSFKPIIGLTLKSVTMSLSNQHCSERMQLIFGNAIDNFSKNGNSFNGTTIILNPSSNVAVLNWWHPMFIKSNYIPDFDEE